MKCCAASNTQTVTNSWSHTQRRKCLPFSIFSMSNTYFVWALTVAYLATSKTRGPAALNGAFIRTVVLEALPWKFGWVFRWIEIQRWKRELFFYLKPSFSADWDRWRGKRWYLMRWDILYFLTAEPEYHFLTWKQMQQIMCLSNTVLKSKPIHKSTHLM